MMTFFQHTALMFAKAFLRGSRNESTPIAEFASGCACDAAEFCAIIEEAERQYNAQQSKIGERDLSVSIPGEEDHD